MIYYAALVPPTSDIDHVARIGHGKDVTMVNLAGKAWLAPGEFILKSPINHPRSPHPLKIILLGLKTPPLNIWTYHHNIHLICSSKTFPCCRWVSDLCRHGCIENPYIICISSVYRHPYIIPIYSFHWPSPAGGGFLICAGAIALDVAEAWTKVGAKSFGVPPEIRIKIQEHRDMRVIRPWVKLTLSNKWGIPEKIFEQRSNRRNETLIFWPVMVLCALEGVDTLTEVRLRFGNEASRKRITD